MLEQNIINASSYECQEDEVEGDSIENLPKDDLLATTIDTFSTVENIKHQTVLECEQNTKQDVELNQSSYEAENTTFKNEEISVAERHEEMNIGETQIDRALNESGIDVQESSLLTNKTTRTEVDSDATVNSIEYVESETIGESEDHVVSDAPIDGIESDTLNNDIESDTAIDDNASDTKIDNIESNAENLE